MEKNGNLPHNSFFPDLLLQAEYWFIRSPNIRILRRPEKSIIPLCRVKRQRLPAEQIKLPFLRKFPRRLVI